MILHRKISLLFAPGAMLLPSIIHAQPQAQTSPAPMAGSLALRNPAEALPKTAAEWAKRLIAYAQNMEENDDILHEFAYTAPEVQLAALKDCWKKLNKEEERSHLMEVIESETAGQADYEPDDATVSADRVNPYLLDILTLGATDDSADVRKRTSDCLIEIAGQTFADPKDFLAWRKAQGDKSLTEITRNGVAALFVKFAKADDKSRVALYETLSHFVFVSDSRAAENHPLGGANAIKLTAARRQAALDTGLLDALALRLHKPADALESAKIAELLVAFQPDDTYLAQIEPDMKREAPALAAAPSGEYEPGVSTLVTAVTLLSRYTSAWAVIAFNQIVEETYGTQRVVELVNGLTASRSPRVIPVLIALLDGLPADAQTSAVQELAKLTRVPGGAKQTAAWWRDWLTKNRASLPEAVRSLPQPKIKTGKELVLDRLRSGATENLDGPAREIFYRMDADTQLEVLRAALPKIASENLRRDLLALAAGTNGGSDEGGANPPPANPHLLEILDLGVNDPALSVQQQAISEAGDIALQNFADKEDYAAWRKQTSGKSVEAIVRDSATAFASQFKSADTTGKLERFDLLLRQSYVTESLAKTERGITTHTFTAKGMEKARREASLQAGLLDSMAELLRDAKSPDLAQKALTFLSIFQPDDFYLQKVEPDARRLLEGRVAQGFTSQGDAIRMPDNAPNLLFRYHSAWVMPLLINWTQRDYLTPGLDALIAALTGSNDARAIPILIALAGTVGHNDANGMLSAVSTITGVNADSSPNGVSPDPNHEVIWWRNWWEKNRASYPAEVRDVVVPGLKTGVAALEERILHNSEQYGMDYRARNQLAELDAESKYKVMREMWNRDLSDAVKANMLMTLAEGQNGSDPFSANPHLLEELHLGMMDEEPQTQQQAANVLFGLTMQPFPDQDDYLAWRKRSGGKSLAELARDGVTAFVGRFRAADEAQKIEMLQKAQQTQFLDGFSMETVGGKPTETIQAKGLTEIRRKAVIAAGLPDAVAALAQSENSEATLAAASFLSSFHAGASYLAGMENGVKRVYAKMLAKPEDNPNLSLDLLLSYHGTWVGETLSQIVQKTYLLASSGNTIHALMYSRDRRVTPLLISLIDSVGANDKQQLLRQLPQIVGIPFDGVPFDTSHDAAWWREWWKKNLDKQPPEAQAISLLDLKKGPEIVAARLTQPKQDTDWEVMQMFETLDAETQYAILRDNWKKIGSEQIRVNLIERAANENNVISDNLRSNMTGDNSRTATVIMPHLLDILALGVEDPADQVRNDALGFASNIAARRIADAKDFTAWRKQVGDKPLTDVVRENTLNLIARMKQADAKTLPALLDVAGFLHWYSFQSGDGGITSPDSKVTAVGLAAVRRKAALDAGLPDKIAEWLKPVNPPEVTKKALTLAMQLLPGHEFMQAIEPDVQRLFAANTLKPGDYDFVLSSILSYYSDRWATDVLLATARAQYGEMNQDEIISLLANSRDARVIPSLIAVLTDMDEQSWQRQQINQALARLTHTGAGAIHDADWWRNWWKKNRTELPEAAQKEPFPDFSSKTKLAKDYSVKRSRKRFDIGGDAKRSYWFVTSGLLLKRKASVTTVANRPADDFTDIPAAERPGLLVALADGDSDGTGTRYWQDLIGKNFGGKYLAAVVIAPKWREKQNTLWLTKSERGGIKEASFTTEALAAQIVKDVEAKYPVNPARVFLVGVGAGGQAAYACSLESQTPFAGFALIGSPFRSSLLPPFTHAKGRRYYVLHSPDDKQVPYFLAKVALETLQKAGASAKLAPYAINPDSAQKAGRDAVAEGVKWLETAK